MKVIMTNDHLKRFGGLSLLLVTYVSDYMFVPTPAAAAHAPAAAAVPHRPSASVGAALDPELDALADSLVALKLGATKACLAFAEVLHNDGVVCIADLACVSETDAHDVLTCAGMSKIQLNKVMQAVTPAPAPALALGSPHGVCRI
jgi:hypothetical protein